MPKGCCRARLPGFLWQTYLCTARCGHASVFVTCVLIYPREAGDIFDTTRG